MVFSIALLFLFPQRAVTQREEKLQFLWELLAPGTSPCWGVVGGFILVAWIYFVAQDYYFYKRELPYLVAVGLPSITSYYGVPVPGRTFDVFKFMLPSRAWRDLVPAVLFLVNLVLVLRRRRAT
jgi:hypothetical protein